ncbi:MAG: NYN domain-containing protein [Armatimonadetes bacterium]|nr:NYN domain-containing protein [Armatimonadota bacterium]
MTTAVYVDGFNLYCGLARPLDCKWVDFQQYFERHFPDDDIRVVYFFEALVEGPSQARQREYIRALQTRPKIQVALGKMKRKERRCRVTACRHAGDRRYLDYEEKYTDVKIALTMLDDTHRGLFEKLILVTADTDLVPAVQLAKQRRPHQRIVVRTPALHKRRYAAHDLRVAADHVAVADAELLLKCQFPRKLLDESGHPILRPTAWRQAPLNAVRIWQKQHSSHRRRRSR